MYRQRHDLNDIESTLQACIFSVSEQPALIYIPVYVKLLKYLFFKLISVEHILLESLYFFSRELLTYCGWSDNRGLDNP